MRSFLQTLAVFICVSICFTSCIEIEEVILFKKKGSGQYEMKIDASKAFAMLSMLGVQEEEVKMAESIDSFFYLGDLISESAKDSMSCREKLEKVSVSFELNVDEEIANLHLIMPFKELYEVDDFFACMASMGDQMGGGKGLGKMDMRIAGAFRKLYKAEKKSLARNAIVMDKMPALGDMMGDGENANEMLTYMNMFMSQLEYTTTIIVPKKIKEVSYADKFSRPDKKTVQYTNDIEDWVKNKKVQPFSMTYK